MDENATTPTFDALPADEQRSDVVESGKERTPNPPDRVPMTDQPLTPDPATGERVKNGLVASEFYRKLYAEWDELAAQHPPPTRDDIRPEWAWVHAHLADHNTIDPENRYWGLHLAVYNQRVVGADVDPVRLHVAMARELGIHPERMVVFYFGELYFGES